jgi:hypothetical protein
VSWARFDDGYDDSAKVRRALREGIMGLAAVGLHVLSVTQSARRETDGLVDVDWLDATLHRLSARDRARLIELATSVGFLEDLPTGETTHGTDTKGCTVEIGPRDEPAYVVHDYLDFNDSSAYLAERRRKDAQRKAGGIPKDSAPTPRGLRLESERSPQGFRGSRARVPDPTRPDQSPPDPPRGGRQRDRDRFAAETAAWVAEHAPHPDSEPVEWDGAMGRLREAISDAKFEMYLGGLHPHGRLPDGRFALGAPKVSGGWAAGRFKDAIEAAVGEKIMIVECGHVAAAA